MSRRLRRPRHAVARAGDATRSPPTQDEVLGRPLTRFFVDVAGRQASVGPVLLEPLHGLRLLLPLGLAIDAEASEGERLEPALRDVRLAALAHPVASILDAGE